MNIEANKIRKLAKDFMPWVQDIRHHLHKYPELSFEEHKTKEFIKSKLKELNITEVEEIAGTGLAASIKGKHNGTCIALRSEMDALPITELNDTEYKSQNKGIMHACGHDVHMASMLGALRIINEIKTEIKGNILAIFQPGEEKLPGGANKIIKSGIFEKHSPKLILGQHVMPNMPKGTLGFRAGEYMASTDEIYITFKGNGGHIAVPTMTKDIISAAAECILQIKEDITRQAGSIPVVLGFGKIEAEGSNNIIPPEVKLHGTFRTMDEKFRKYAKDQIRIKVERLSKKYGIEGNLEIIKGYPSLKNHNSFTNDAKDYALELLGSNKIINLDKRMTGEDFAYYSQVMPSVFYRLGIAGTEKGFENVHNPYFGIDEEALEIGSMGMAWLAIRFLNNF